MTWRATITFCAACAVGLWGCGGSGGGGGTEYHRIIPDGYSEVSFTADGTTNSGIRHSLAALLDASATGTGSGTGVGGPTSIFDGIAVTCVFTFGVATTVEGYTVTTNSTLCPNKNECIVCTNVDPNTDHCSLTCTGVVPSSAAAAADDFQVSAVFTSIFSTDMPDPYGTIRLDAVKTATAAFDLMTAAAPDSIACDGTGTTLGMSNIAQGTWYANSALTYKAGLTIDSVNVGTSDCSITNTFNATATLTGAATPGSPITNNLGTVALESTICDYEDASATTSTLSDCQPVTAPPAAGIVLYSVTAPNGNLGGRSGADSVCVAAASSQSLSCSSMKAFISVSPEDQISDMPTLYGVPTNLPIQSSISTQIAGTWAALLNAGIAPLDSSLSGAGVMPSGQQWWAGSSDTGTYNGFTCINWTDGNLQFGNIGNGDATGTQWMAQTFTSCNTATLYMLCLCY